MLKYMQEMAVASINDGYTKIVYNFIKNGGQLTDKDACPFAGFDLEKIWNEAESRGLPKFTGGTPVAPNFKNITQYTRLTLICDDAKVVHQIMSLSSGEAKKTSVIGSFNIFAVRTSESE